MTVTPVLEASLMQAQVWHHGGMYMGLHWAWWLVSILTIGLILWAVWRAMADRGETRRRATEREDAEELLRSRFARGEIDEEEFLRRMRVLRE